MANAILVTDDDVIICDSEGEYGNLVRQFNGEVIKVSSKSKDYLNPLDINMNYGDGDAPLKDKANFIMSMLELVVGGSGLTAEEKSVIDRCLPKIYEKYFNEPEPKNMPILQDLYDMLKNQEEKVGKKLATEMEIYVSESLNGRTVIRPAPPRARNHHDPRPVLRRLRADLPSHRPGRRDRKSTV